MTNNITTIGALVSIPFSQHKGSTTTASTEEGAEANATLGMVSNTTLATCYHSKLNSLKTLEGNKHAIDILNDTLSSAEHALPTTDPSVTKLCSYPFGSLPVKVGIKISTNEQVLFFSLGLNTLKFFLEALRTT